MRHLCQSGARLQAKPQTEEDSGSGWREEFALNWTFEKGENQDTSDDSDSPAVAAKRRNELGHQRWNELGHQRRNELGHQRWERTGSPGNELGHQRWERTGSPEMGKNWVTRERTGSPEMGKNWVTRDGKELGHQRWERTGSPGKELGHPGFQSQSRSQ
ncbi:hypothetical protein ACOMHN_002490 [Nucella lapillus]